MRRIHANWKRSPKMDTGAQGELTGAWERGAGLLAARGRGGGLTTARSQDGECLQTGGG